MRVPGDDAEAEAAEEGDAGVGPPTLPVLLAELGVFLSYILIIVDALQSGGTDGSFCFVLCWCSTIFYCATNQHLHWYVRELCKKTERETKAKGLSPHARDNQLQVGSSGGPIRPLVAEILIFYPHRQGGKITARPLFCGRPMDWVRAETEQSLRTKNTVRYGSYAEYLRLTTMFFFFAEIAYVEAPTPRVFGQLSAETRRFTPAIPYSEKSVSSIAKTEF